MIGWKYPPIPNAVQCALRALRYAVRVLAGRDPVTGGT